MVWNTFTADEMDSISRRLLMPLILMVNYTLLLYLLAFYWSRRNENRVRLLFAVAFLGVGCLVPFADPDDFLVSHLNDVSESCCVLTFLLQITIIGHDLNKKIKFKTVMALTRMAEMLIVADLAIVLISFVDVMDDDLLPDAVQDQLPNICENVTLAFIFLFRYYYIVVSRGWRDIWANRKVEVAWYLLFATHEVPFDVLEGASGLSWESIQSLWNRVTLAGCLYITARTKLRDSSKLSGNSTVAQVTLSRSGATSGRTRSGQLYVVKPARQPSVRDQGSHPRVAVGASGMLTTN